jgi:hypothetical protein
MQNKLLDGVEDIEALETLSITITKLTYLPEQSIPVLVDFHHSLSNSRKFYFFQLPL